MERTKPPRRCTVVVGGFWGDEGKGKIADYVAHKIGAKGIARAGVGPNAGHTVVKQGKVYKLRMVPAAFDMLDAKMFIGAGVLVDVKCLRNEIEMTGIDNRIIVDRQTGIIEAEHKQRDQSDAHLTKKIGTAGAGTGPANEARARRTLRMAKDVSELEGLVGDVASELHAIMDRGDRILIEGSQATFLSLYHGTYPFVTSKDVCAAAACSDVGIGPTNVEDVVLVFKAYVTRVGKGDLEGELSEEETKARGWAEVGTVTGRVRRAAPFNYELARKSVALNGATQLAITKIDTVFPEMTDRRSPEDITPEVREFIEKIEKATGVPVTLLGTGPDSASVIDLL